MPRADVIEALRALRVSPSEAADLARAQHERLTRPRSADDGPGVAPGAEQAPRRVLVQRGASGVE